MKIRVRAGTFTQLSTLAKVTPRRAPGGLVPRGARGWSPGRGERTSQSALASGASCPWRLQDHPGPRAPREQSGKILEQHGKSTARLPLPFLPPPPPGLTTRQTSPLPKARTGGGGRTARFKPAYEPWEARVGGGCRGRTGLKARTASFRGPPGPKRLPSPGFILLWQGRQMLTSLHLCSAQTRRNHPPNHLLPCATPHRCTIPGVSIPVL